MEQSENINKNLSPMANKIINVFLRKIEKYPYNSKIMEFNLKTIKFEYQNMDYAYGKYDFFDNTVLFNKLNLNVLFHELLHMSTTYIDEERQMVFCGFSELSENFSFGIGLNEGYTELLTSRLTNRKSSYITEIQLENPSIAYSVNIQACQLIEQIIGKEKLEKYYFDLNVMGLIDELAKYTDKKSTIAFIKKLDLYTKADSNHINNPKKYYNLTFSMSKYLNHAFRNKMKIENVSNAQIDEYNKFFLNPNYIAIGENGGAISNLAASDYCKYRQTPVISKAKKYRMITKL